MMIENTESETPPDRPKTAPRPLVPQPIRQLPQEVVNRIAAGEVIQRPANAIKELLENSLDAGSTHIQVTVRNGGLKMLQVQDDGCGIRVADLPLLCERFTTSKLREFSDLSSLLTFGFRGEALASLSHVSLLTVTTRTADQACAYRMNYRDGKPTSAQATACAANPGTTILAEDLFYNAPLRKQALRNAREEFARVAEVVSQYAIHYAPKCGFHLRSIASGASVTGSDLRTSAGWSRMDAVRVVIGSAIAQNLVSFNSCQPGSSEATSLAIERLGLRFEGLLTNPSQISSGSSPTMKLNLFINNRMVESTAIKRALESSYSTVLSRGLNASSTPLPTFRRLSGQGRSATTLFVYMNLQLPPESLDVNVHPTKAEVHFLHEEQIIAGLQDAIERAMLSCAQVRSFLTKPLPLAELNDNSSVCPEENGNAKLTLKATAQSTFRPHEKVRVDCHEQRLERFMAGNRQISSSIIGRRDSAVGSKVKRFDSPIGSPELEEDEENNARFEMGRSMAFKCHHTSSSNTNPSDIPPATEPQTPSCPPKLESPQTPDNLLNPSSTLSLTCPTSARTSSRRRIVRLESVRFMQQAIFDRADDQARRLLRSCKMVGLIDRCRCLVQYSTDLILVQLEPLSRHFFHQLLVMNFANHGQITLSEPAPLLELLELGQSVCSSASSQPPRRIFAQEGADRLMQNAPMLWDYFSLKFELDEQTHEPMLVSLPLLLDKYVPDLDYLPCFLSRLATEVNWTEELDCFQDVCRLMADFYALHPPLRPRDDSSGSDDESDLELKVTPNRPRSGLHHGRKWVIEHIVWPAIASSLIPCQGLLYESLQFSQTETRSTETTCAFFRLARLSDLYKVFERC